MICENCGKEHDECYGSGRFCSKECARSYSTKNITGYLKEAKCIDCGKIIYVGKRASNKKCRCEECNKIHNQITCPICGSIYDPKSGGCKNNFCKHHNIKQFKIFIKYFGFDETKLGTSEVENEFNRIRNNLINLYWNQQLSFDDIAKQCGYKGHSGNFSKFFNHLNIERRTFKETGKLIVVNGKIKSKTYNHTTWNNKKVFLRSSYELDYAKELDEQKIDYEVESLVIPYFDSQKEKYRCAIPDFYIPNQNLIVEIKSNWTLNKQNMIDKFKSYKQLGYNYKLICEHKEIKL